MNVRCTSYVPNHPWFATGLKRKRSTVRSSDADGSVEAATKKRRQNAIERGMASLTLEPSAITQSAASQIPPPAAAPYSQSVIPSLSPAIAETSRPVQEVRMKSASSYEPEKDSKWMNPCHLLCVPLRHQFLGYRSCCSELGF